MSGRLSRWSLSSESATLRRQGLVRLIDVGIVKGKKARDLKVGDTILYNYGTTGLIKKIESASPQFLTITVSVKDQWTGKTKLWVQKRKKDALVPVSSRNPSKRRRKPAASPSCKSSRKQVSSRRRNPIRHMILGDLALHGISLLH